MHIYILNITKWLYISCPCGLKVVLKNSLSSFRDMSIFSFIPLAVTITPQPKLLDDFQPKHQNNQLKNVTPEKSEEVFCLTLVT